MTSTKILALLTFVFWRVTSQCVCDSIVSANRRLQASSERTVHFSKGDLKAKPYSRPKGKAFPNSDLKSNGDMRVESASECAAEQIHLTLGDQYGSVIISFATFGNITVDSKLSYSTSESALLDGTTSSPSVFSIDGVSYSYTQLLYVRQNAIDPYMGVPPTTAQTVLDRLNTYSWAYNPDTGAKWSNWYNVTEIVFDTFMQYNNPQGVYNSPLLHTIIVNGLIPGVKYYYRVSSSCTVYSFTIPEQPTITPKYPLSLALCGDLGQTEVSQASVNAMMAMNADAAVIIGDLSYADGWSFLWDSFGNLIQPLAAMVPVFTTGGNHEIDNGESWIAYLSRFPTAYRKSKSSNPCYWAREVGPIHMISVCSYAAYSNSSLQYRWLSQYLSTSIDRTRTPWVVVMMHIPFYNSNTNHWMEGELIRRSFEPLLFKYGVDIVLNGHVHSYERILPTYDYALNECGPTYLNLGDGGNYEGPSGAWIMVNNTADDDATGDHAPVWSAFREDSFGVGELQFLNSTSASFGWHRHACGSDDASAYFMNFSQSCTTPGDNSVQKMITSDGTMINRPPASSCPNRYMSTLSGETPTNSPTTSNNSNSGVTNAEIGLSVAVAILSVSCAVLAYLLHRATANKSAGVNGLLSSEMAPRSSGTNV